MEIKPAHIGLGLTFLLWLIVQVGAAVWIVAQNNANIRNLEKQIERLENYHLYLAIGKEE